jgi:hypothetical protein
MKGKVLPPVYLLLALVAMAGLHFVWPVAEYLSFPGETLPAVVGSGHGLSVLVEP